MSQTIARLPMPTGNRLKPAPLAASAHINPRQPTLTRLFHSFWPLTSRLLRSRMGPAPSTTIVERFEAAEREYHAG